MEQAKNEMKLRRRRIRSALVTGTRYLDAVLATLVTAGVRHVVVIGAPGSMVSGLRISQADTPAEAIAAIEPGEQVVVVDADQPADVWLPNLLAEKRINVLVVQPRLAHQIESGTLRFALEPVDVPWYSRRVIAVSRDLLARHSHGEVLASGILAASLVPVLRAAADAHPHASLAELVALLVQEHDFYAHALPAPAWQLSA